MKDQQSVTMDEAVEAYAAAWNNLDFSRFEPLVAEDVQYVSQNVIVEIDCKTGLMAYFRDLVEVIRFSPEKKVFAELGMTMPYDMYPKGGEPCVILSQGGKDHIIALVLFELKENKISKIEHCTFIPDPCTAHRSGNYPK